MKFYPKNLLWAFLLFLSFNSYAQFTVTNTLDSGPGSLRQAITNANVSGIQETIDFNIAVAGPWIINLVSPLPPITNANGMVIDGTTQPGWTFGDANAMVIVDGAGAGNSSLIDIQAADSEVYGLVLTGAQGSGATGFGVYINQDAYDNAVIGAAGKGNVISGNAFGGIRIRLADNAKVQGNRIGTSIDGLSANGNLGFHGIYLDATDGTIIGGNALTGEGNVISRMGQAG
ncbi:MAG: hypothetical protein RIA63_12850, partial [Cyclobacteriaceae bacterium]